MQRSISSTRISIVFDTTCSNGTVLLKVDHDFPCVEDCRCNGNDHAEDDEAETADCGPTGGAPGPRDVPDSSPPRRRSHAAGIR